VDAPQFDGKAPGKDKNGADFDQFFPMLVILAENPKTGEVTGGQREYLAYGGRGFAPVDKKLRKKTAFGCSLVGSVCRMAEPVKGRPLLVGEGWASAKTAMDAADLPGWGVFGLSGLRSFDPPASVDWVILLAENDEAEQNAKALAEIVPKLLERGLKVGVAYPPPGCGDLNDLVRERDDKTRLHGTAEAGRKIVFDIIKKAARSSRTKEELAAGAGKSGLPGVDDDEDNKPQFTMEPGGLYRGKMSICPPFEVIAETRDDMSNDWGLHLRFKNSDDMVREEIIPSGALCADPSTIASRLRSIGLRVSPLPAAKTALAVYLGDVAVKPRVLIAKRTGWLTVKGEPVFALPSQTIGSNSERVVLTGDGGTVIYAQAGALADWQEHIGKPAGQHLLMQFAISVAWAATLLQMSGGESGGFHLWEFSTKGKTTVQQVAASNWGSGALNGGYIRRWRATANHLEATFASASDTCLILDEISQLGYGELAQVVYTLTGEVGKGRLRPDATARTPYSWRTLLLSSGEVPISSRIDEDRHQKGGRSRELRGGASVRVIDIPADRRHGAFDQPAGEPDFSPAVFAERMQAAAATYYGTAGPAFVKALIDEKVTGAAVRQAVSKFIVSVLGGASSDDGQVRRVARRFGLVAVAGTMAIGAGIVNWDAEAFTEGVRGLFRSWVKARGYTGSIEAAQIVARARLFFERYGESRFDDVEPSDLNRDRPVGERAGYKNDEPDGRRWYVLPQVWGEIFPGVGRKAAAILSDMGVLERGYEKDRPTKKVQLGNLKPQNFYVINQRIFEGWDEPDRTKRLN
jgi:uncharacterized protein (DUF927 family)